MHEFHIADNIVKFALAEAEKRNGKCITLLRIKLGSNSHITPESLEMCIQASMKDTIAAEAAIDIEVFTEIVKCLDCTHSSPISDDTNICRNCGSINIEIIKEEEVYLDSLQIEQRD